MVPRFCGSGHSTQHPGREAGLPALQPGLADSTVMPSPSCPLLGTSFLTPMLAGTVWLPRDSWETPCSCFQGIVSVSVNPILQAPGQPLTWTLPHQEAAGFQANPDRIGPSFLPLA